MEGNKVYVGKIPREFKKDELLAAFADCGKIQYVRIINRFRGHPSTCFLTFETPAGAQNAAKKNGMTFMNVPIVVELARPRTEKPVREPKPKRELTAAEMAAIPSSIYLGNLSFKVTEDDIRKAFGQYGTVKSVKIMGEVRRLGYGYVEFSTPQEAEKACAFNGQLLNERPLRVEKAKGPQERAATERKPRQPRKPRTAAAPRPRRERKPRNEDSPVPIDDKTAFIGQLPENVQPERIHEALKIYGQILNIQLATVENRPKYGFVHYQTKEEAQKAIAANGKVTIDGKTITIEVPRPRRQAGPRQPREPRAPRDNAAPRPRRERKPRPEPAAQAECHVANLPRAMPVKEAEETLRKMFGSFGTIASVTCPQFPSGDFRGFAYVKFANVDAATKARSLTNTEVGGRKIAVTYALPADQRKTH